jgi:hypothetical protein
MVTQIYKKFKIEYGTDDEGRDKLNGNILWMWPDFLKAEMNKLVKFEDVVEAINSSSICL